MKHMGFRVWTARKVAPARVDRAIACETKRAGEKVTIKHINDYGELLQAGGFVPYDVLDEAILEEDVVTGDVLVLTEHWHPFEAEDETPAPNPNP